MNYLTQLLLALDELQAPEKVVSDVLYWYYICSSNRGLPHGWHCVSFALNYGIPLDQKPLAPETLAYKLSRMS